MEESHKVIEYEGRYQIKFQYYNFFEGEKWMKGYVSKKWESTPNLCVLAHGLDVDLIMKASCKNINLLNNSFGVIKLDPLQLWSRPC